MIKQLSCALIVMSLLAACIYRVPLSEQHDLAIDPAHLGLWHSVQGDEEERILVLRFSDTEYLVHYPVDSEADYYRAWLVEVNGMRLLQLELIGDNDGPIAADKQDVYAVASVTLEGNQAHIAMLNPQVVSDKISDSAALRQALVDMQDHPDLFDEPVAFTRMSDGG